MNRDRKRRALAGSTGACQACQLQVLASEEDDFCPWCEERRQRYIHEPGAVNDDKEN